MKERKSYPKEFKKEVLEMAAGGERNVAQLERELGITAGLIYKWRERYQINEGNGRLQASEVHEAAAEIRQLKRELEIVRQERDILKKAIRIFSKEQLR